MRRFVIFLKKLLDPRNPSSYKPALADGHCGNAAPAAGKRRS
jgi:hypothetical protein